MNEITQARVRSAWFIRLAEHTSLADFSVSVAGLSNSIAAVDEGDGCIIVRKDEDGHVAVAFARIYRSRVTSDAVTVHFDGIVRLDPPWDLASLGVTPPDTDVSISRLDWEAFEKARIEVLGRLALLNKERYEEKAAQWLHSTGKTAEKKTTTRKNRLTAELYDTPSCFDRDFHKITEPPSPKMDIFSNQQEPKPTEEKGNECGTKPIDQILAWLKPYPCWHTKRDIIAGYQADDNAWDDTVDELLKDDFIDAQDRNGEVEYRAAQPLEHQYE